MYGDDIGKQQGYGSLALVLGLHGDEQHLGGLRVVPLEGFQQVPPTEGEHAAACLLEGLGQGGEQYGKAYEIVVFIDDEWYQTEVEQGQIGFDVLLYLLF